MFIGSGSLHHNANDAYLIEKYYLSSNATELNKALDKKLACRVPLN